MDSMRTNGKMPHRPPVHGIEYTSRAAFVMRPQLGHIVVVAKEPGQEEEDNWQESTVRENADELQAHVSHHGADDAE